jgi:hypothetical protein
MDEDTLRLLAEEIAKVNIRHVDDPCSLFDWIAEMFTDEHPTMKQRVDATILADKAIAKVAQAALTALQEAGLVIVPVEPTREMIAAGRENNGLHTVRFDPTDAYRAMITAHTASGKGEKT